MFRLLFLFYIRARPILNYAPLNAEAYRRGYGLELDIRIEHAHYVSGLQRARHRTADRNVFGVDLNPIALDSRKSPCG